MEIDVRIEISRPPDVVWPVLVDIEHWPEWTPSMTSVENLDGSAFGIGSRVRIRQPKLKTLVWRVSEFQQGRMFSWEARSPGLCIVSSHEVEASNRGSTVKLRVMQTGLLAPVVSLLFGNLSCRYVNMEAEGLKRRCESPVYPQT